MEALLASALAHAGEVEAALGLPRGSLSSLPALSAGLVLLLTLLYMLGLLPCCRPAAARAGGAVVRSAKAIKRTVLLVGPPGSGKTAMFHQVSVARK
jgi:hypothetical protein